MHKTASHRDHPIAFSGTDAEKQAKVWVPKTPTPRRSAFSEVRQALSRAVQRDDKIVRLEKSNARLRQHNAALRLQLHIPAERVPNPRDTEFFGAKLELHALREEHRTLEARQFVLGRIASADAQLTRVMDALYRKCDHDIAVEANAFFQLLEELDAHRRGDNPEHTTAALFEARIHARLKRSSEVQAAVLRSGAVAFLNKKDPPSTAERSVVGLILFGVLARPLHSKASEMDLKALDSGRLKQVSLSATAILAEVGQLGVKLKPRDKVPGTGLTLQALKRLQKDADALQKKAAITLTTGQNPGAPTTKAKPVRKSPTPSVSQPPVVVQSTAKRDRATADAAQQAFQRTLVEAMNFMWDEDGSDDSFAVVLDASASGLFVKAMVQLQAAGLDDAEQRDWIHDALRRMDRGLLSHLRARLGNGFQERLVHEIDTSPFHPKQDLKDLAAVWWYGVMTTASPSA